MVVYPVRALTQMSLRYDGWMGARMKFLSGTYAADLRVGWSSVAIIILASYALAACRQGPTDMDIGQRLDQACMVTAAAMEPRSPQPCGTESVSYACYRGYSELLSPDGRQRLSPTDVAALRRWVQNDGDPNRSVALDEVTRTLSVAGEDRVFRHYETVVRTLPCPTSCPQLPWAAQQRGDSICIQGGGPASSGMLARSPADPVSLSGSICLSREIVGRVYADCARHWLLKGDAELARQDVQCLTDGAFAGDWTGADRACPGGYRGGQATIGLQPTDTALESAIESWRIASDWGRLFGAQAALVAQQRLQAHTVQCISSASSLERLSRIQPGSAGDTIRLSIRQRALSALGHYGEEIDGRYGPVTTRAVRSFQRELGYDETGVLSPRQTVLLMCHAAQTARDSHIQNTLGIMYAVGLGVEQNTDLALEWLDLAARRGDGDAYFNLAVIYGTGAVLGSYRLCGIIENTDLADAHLAAAARLGHPVAREWRAARAYQASGSSAQRWRHISGELARSAEARGDVLFQTWEQDHIDRAYLEQISLPCLSAEVLRGETP